MGFRKLSNHIDISHRLLILHITLQYLTQCDDQRKSEI